MSQAWKSGYEIDKTVDAWLIYLSEMTGGDADRGTVGWHDFTAPVQGFPVRKGEQMIVMSFSDITVITFT